MFKKHFYTFNIKIADVSIGVEARFLHTKIFCRKYLTNETPDFFVSVANERCEYWDKNRDELVKTWGVFGKRSFLKSMETIMLARKIAEKIVDYNILFFHGVAVAYKGKAYIFAAKPETGKTTHGKLWLKNIPESYILNGDKPFLKIENDKVYVFSGPWRGKENYGKKEILPLSAICFLERDKTNHIEKVALNECIHPLTEQCYVTKNNLLNTLNLFNKFSNVEFYRLRCNMDAEAAFTSFNAMVSER